MTERNESFPSAPQACLLVLGLYAIGRIIGELLQDAQGVLGLTDAQSWVLTTLLANGIVFASVMQFKGLTYRGLFHPAGTSMRGTALATVPGVLLMVPGFVLTLMMVGNFVVQAFPMSPQDKAMFSEMSGTDPAMILLGCAIAPIVEEMLFRGVILRGFLQHYGRAPSIWGAAALFGVAHRNVYQFATALLVGALSGWLYERSRSLVPCITLHAAFNTAIVLLTNLPGDGGLTMTVGGWIGCIVLAGIGVEMLRRTFDRDRA